MKKRLVFVVFILALFSSCNIIKVNHNSVLQYLGKKGNIVITANYKNIELLLREKTGSKEMLDYLGPKTNRVYISSDANGIITGISKGKYSMALLKIGVDSFTDYKTSTAKNGYLTYFTDGTNSIGIPNNNNILFTQGNYENAYENFISYKRKTNIDDKDCAMLLGSFIGIYSLEPKVLPVESEDFPPNLLNQIHKIVLRVDNEENAYYLNGRLEMKDEEFAKSFLAILKTNYVSEKKKNKAKINFKEIKNMLVQNGTVININKMDIDISKYQK